MNTPFYERHRDLHIGDWFFQPTVVAGGLTAIVAAALVIHGFGMKKAGRMDGGADFEKVRAWDAKHPEKSIGQYEYSILDGDPLKLKASQDAIKAEQAAAEAAADEVASEIEEGR